MFPRSDKKGILKLQFSACKSSNPLFTGLFTPTRFYPCYQYHALHVSGIELAENLRKIKPDLAVIFITAHQEYSLDAFKLYASDYILKPINQERVKTTFCRIQQMKMPEKSNPTYDPQKSIISINLGNERVFLKLIEIFYMEKLGRHTLIHCVNGAFKTRETLQDLERYLGKSFFRSHKSYIISIDWIDRIINCPHSSCYEVRFKDYKGKALLSRDRIQALMAYSHYNA